jgi:hypothetical protein
MRSLFLISCLALSSLAACGGDDTIDISGDTPEQAADEIAGAVCAQQSECGEWSIDCTSDGTSTTCTATHSDVTVDACVAEARPEILSDLQCVDLTPEQEQTINDCINGLAAMPCISQDEMDAYVAAIEAGMDPEPPGGAPPAECDQLEAIFSSCQG